ncbi:MAG TPA: DUF3592 domain-containing protein [Anaerolineales bacterium]|nr:DUF3592 domain-containing protein [Anaerolineales bacterium]HRQ91308.1 DUF3592 domain-containing protein [Anaerolineales bacterium]
MTLLRNIGFLLLANLLVVAMAAGTIWLGWRGYELSTRGESTIGRVVALEESSDGDGGCCVYSPVIEFNANGNPVRFEGGNASDPPAYRVGQEVEVLYLPEDPSKAAINSFYELWMVTVILAPVTFILFIVLNWVAIARMRNGQAVMDNHE